MRPKIWRVSSRAAREMWKVSGGGASSSSESADEGGMGGALKLYVVKRDLSRKAEATRACQCGRVDGASSGRRTLHDARLVDREPQPLFSQQHVSLVCKGDAAQEGEQLAGRAGHGGQDGRLVLHGRCSGWGEERARRQREWRIEVLLHSHRLQRRPGYQGTKRRRRLRRSCTLHRTWSC